MAEMQAIWDEMAVENGNLPTIEEEIWKGGMMLHLKLVTRISNLEWTKESQEMELVRNEQRRENLGIVSQIQIPWI
jgi:hypothetical protein